MALALLHVAGVGLDIPWPPQVLYQQHPALRPTPCKDKLCPEVSAGTAIQRQWQSWECIEIWDWKELVVKCQRVSKQAVFYSNYFSTSWKIPAKIHPEVWQVRRTLRSTHKTIFFSLLLLPHFFFPKKRKQTLVSQCPSANKFLSASVFKTWHLSVAWRCPRVLEMKVAETLAGMSKRAQERDALEEKERGSTGQ